MNEKQNSPASGRFTEAEISAVCKERNVSPLRALELLESAAWHRAVEDGRAKKTATPAPAPAPKP